MILKVLIADGRTTNVCRNLGNGSWWPAVDHLFAGFDHIEYGGPVWSNVDDIPIIGEGPDALRDAVFAELCEHVPDDPKGWSQTLNLLGRHSPTGNGFTELVDLQNTEVGKERQYPGWWAKLYWLWDDKGDKCCMPVTIIHDARAFLCDDANQTIERLGPQVE
jgi:hypothetical protein